MRSFFFRKTFSLRKQVLRITAPVLLPAILLCSCSFRTSENAGLARTPGVEIVMPLPQWDEVAMETFDIIDAVISSDVANGFPAAQLTVMKDGAVLYENAWGSVRKWNEDGTQVGSAPAVTTDTLFDLASVTKMFSVNYALQKMVTDGTIGLDTTLVSVFGNSFANQTVSYAWSEFDDSTMESLKSRLTIRDLLCHQAGFPPDPRSFSQYMQIAMAPHTREEIRQSLFRVPLTYEPGSKTSYSDLDYMLLGLVIEEVTGQRLDDYLRETVFEPMGLSRITYNPLENGFGAEEIAATEPCGNTRDGYVSHTGIRTHTLQGEVHDENAFHAMHGVSGHAGLFSNAHDLAQLANLMLTGASGNTRFFSREVIDAFTAPKNAQDAEWGLGWWRAADGERAWFFGEQSPSNVFGHQGWTGTNVIIDPENNLVVVFLTNRIHSHITNPTENLERFDGNWYTSATPGWLCRLLHIGTADVPVPSDGTPDTEDPRVTSLMDMFSDLTLNSFYNIPKKDVEKDSDHPAVQNVKSKLEAFRKIAEQSGKNTYLKTASELEEAWEDYHPGGEDQFRWERNVANGDTRLSEYLPLLEKKRVALFTNHTGVVYDAAEKTERHLLDVLVDKNVNVSVVFSPEHGFRGEEDAGATVTDDTDEKTGVPVHSLYRDGRTQMPDETRMDLFDTLVIDIQDVGVRFYTYYLTMYDLMNACAAQGKEVIVLDRVNPNGFYVDGPILREAFHSGIGRLPLPVVHGMTPGELALMINGEGWLDTGADSLNLTVIACTNYTHSMKSSIAHAPSPNLKDMRAVFLYPSVALFENSALSVGRGTEEPFVVFGSPHLASTDGYDHTFTPQSMSGAANPPYIGEICHGLSMRELDTDTLLQGKLDLTYLVDAYHAMQNAHPEIDFFGTPDSAGYYPIDYLCGTDRVRLLLTEGKTAKEIRADWLEDVALFQKQRAPYLLYPE